MRELDQVAESARDLAARPKPLTRQVNWSGAEVVVALLVTVYADPSKLGGSKRRADGSVAQHPAILAAAHAIGRTPDAVVFKVMNLRSVLTEGHRGLSRTARIDRWAVETFGGRLDLLLAAAHQVAHVVPGIDAVLKALVPGPAARAVGEDEPVYPDDAREGTDVLALRRERRGQGLFRNRVLTNYAHGCAFCGLRSNKPDQNSYLLVASHIRPWATSDGHQRLDPANGLSLCATHDRAFEWGFLGIDDTDRSRTPRLVASTAAREEFSHGSGRPTRARPGRDPRPPWPPLLHPDHRHYQPPAPDHLRHHREHVFDRRFRAG